MGDAPAVDAGGGAPEEERRRRELHQSVGQGDGKRKCALCCLVSLFKVHFPAKDLIYLTVELT